jgi:hypothetical protein
MIACKGGERRTAFISWVPDFLEVTVAPMLEVGGLGPLGGKI